jgi:hypothetical protein
MNQPGTVRTAPSIGFLQNASADGGSERRTSRHIENFAVSFSRIIETHPSLQINLGWPPAANGSLPLRRLKAIAAETARQGPTLPPPPPTKAITEWQNS